MFLMKSAARAVNVRVMPLVALVLDVRNGDGYRLGFVAHRAAFGDVGVGDRRRQTLLRLSHDNCGGQSGLAVVNMPDGADVNVRFRSLKLFFSHCCLLRLVFG